MRSLEVLSNTMDFTLENAMNPVLDTLTPVARFWQESMITAYDKYREELENIPQELHQAAEAVRPWNDQVKQESLEATVLRFWHQAYAEKYPGIRW